MKLSQPQQIMAQDRKIIDEAYAGDVIGIFDPGLFSIGDTITVPGKKFEYEGIPTFAPEHFCRLVPVDSMKKKQFMKGVTQIAQEGAIQIFQDYLLGMSEIIVGVVGVLQFEVLEYRLKNEYNVEVIRNNLPYQYIRWIRNKDIDVKNLNLTSDTKWVQDFKGNNILIFTSEWNINWALEKNEGLILEDFNKD
jgi:peptide chain release factor 3